MISHSLAFDGILLIEMWSILTLSGAGVQRLQSRMRNTKAHGNEGQYWVGTFLDNLF